MLYFSVLGIGPCKYLVLSSNKNNLESDYKIATGFARFPGESGKRTLVALGPR